jgi:U3 small nucleolar RNA-associated protein 21
MAETSKIFRPFRALGLYCNAVPCVLQSRGTETFVTASIGRSFQIFDCAKLTLSFVSSDPLPKKIRALAACGDLTFTAVGCDIYAWYRGRIKFKMEEHNSQVVLLLCLGNHLISICKSSVIHVWDCNDGEMQQSVELHTPQDTPTSLVHPPTYLNKVLVGFSSGALVLVNINSGKVIHRFSPMKSGVRCIASSMAPDVVAVGCDDGSIVIQDIRCDDTLFKFQHSLGACQCLAYCPSGQPFLISGCSSGAIFVWNLESRRLIFTADAAHSSAVCSLHFLSGQSIFLSSGQDNRLQMFAFDSDGSVRLLRQRCGHSEPPTKVSFYNPDGSVILSAGSDKSFRSFSAIQDQQNVELSQGNIVHKAKKLKVDAQAIKLPPVIDFSFSFIRERDWNNVVTCHAHTHDVYLWHFADKVKAKKTLRRSLAPRVHAPPATSVSCTFCGNFVFVGYSDGQIHRFNLQSGLHRGCIATSINGHAVCSLTSNALNTIVLSAGLTRNLTLWSFDPPVSANTVPQPLHTLDAGAPISKLVNNRNLEMVACICDDGSLCLIDYKHVRIVRRFCDMGGLLQDACFSPDGRWLIVSSSDCSVRVFDVPTSSLIDWFQFDRPVTSMSMSPNADFLAITCAGSLAVTLLSNNCHFNNVFLGSTPSAAVSLALPSSAPQMSVSESQSKVPEFSLDVGETTSLVFRPLCADIITMSTVPRAVWKIIPIVDLIKERNKPIQPVQKAPETPFFLPTLSGINPVFVPSATSQGDDVALTSHVFNSRDLSIQTQFQSKLNESDFAGALHALSIMNPSAVDMEIRNLSRSNEMLEFKLFVQMICSQLRLKTNFELVQAYLALFLKVHGDILCQDVELHRLLGELSQFLEETWDSLSDRNMYVAFMLSSYCKMQV